MIDLLVLTLALGVVAYLVGFLELPDPFGKIIRIVLVVILIVAVLRFAVGGGPVIWVR
jgi:hypothetical protein